MGGDNPRLTIGALDPNEYEGEINWVPELQDSGRIEVDAFKGYQGNIVPFQYPALADLSSISRNIFIPNIVSFISNESLLGPQDGVNLNPPAKTQFSLQCNGTKTPEIEFTVQINGIDYPMKKSEMLRPSSIMAPLGFCNANIHGVNDAAESETQFELGLPFLRSVYLAYRFPTGDCPGYYGFAISKGGSVPTSTQTPRATPTDASKCLALVTPSSTPTPTIAVHEGPYSDTSTETYKVYGASEDQWVVLKHINDLLKNEVRGGAISLL
ncbi:hypothetical protein PQX77_012155 [Marasmius sp. AFHP31]|nr:hypothetical protein PQX77_012155 [Marasmius sp. AFHP31]